MFGFNKKQKQKKKLTICVDFDGVIHKYSKGWHDGTIYDDLMPGAIEGIKKLMEVYKVVIFSTRNSHDIIEWLVYDQFPKLPSQGLPFRPKSISSRWDMDDLKENEVGVTSNKVPAMGYIDDRAIHFKDWDHVFEVLAERAEP